MKKQQVFLLAAAAVLLCAGTVLVWGMSREDRSGNGEPSSAAETAADSTETAAGTASGSINVPPAEAVVWEKLPFQLLSNLDSSYTTYYALREQLAAVGTLKEGTGQLLRLDTPEELAVLQQFVKDNRFEIWTGVAAKAESLTFEEDFLETHTLFLIRQKLSVYGFAPEDFTVSARLQDGQLNFSLKCEQKDKGRAMGEMVTSYWLLVSLPREGLEDVTAFSLGNF